MYGEENIISAVIVDGQLHLRYVLLPLTKQREGNLSAKDVIGDKKKMRRTQKFLEKQ